MKHMLCRSVAALLLAVLFGGCTTTTKITRTWKAPDYNGGPVQKVAVLAVDERTLLREILENHFSNYLIEHGQPAFRTHNVLSLQQIKDSRDASVAAIKQEGVDSVLMIRLVNSTMKSSLVRATDSAYVPITTGIDSYYGWYDYYTVAYMDMGVVRGNTKTTLHLQSSLYDLNTGKMLWSGLSEAEFKEETDRVASARKFIDEVYTAAKAAGVMR
jgi:hypothetical protein